MEIGTIRAVNIEEEMRTAFLDYSMSVIVSRALPDVRDGLKPVHRRILFSMNENNIRYNTSYRKSARIVGDVMGKYHPHGDAAVYETLVRLAQDFSMRYPLVDGQGNFGSIDGDPPAADRYTEARLAQISEELLQDLDRGTVEFVPNYDGSEQQPSVLPAKLPNLLLNGSQGIAVGMATNIPTHNLNELCDAIIAMIENPDIGFEELIQIVTGPDFPTAGIIMGREGIKEAYTTGKGRIVLRAKAHTEENKGRFSIIVNELPFMVNKALLIEKIADLVQNGKIDGISGLRDESDRNGIRVVIELKRDAQPKKLLNQLFKYTQLQTGFSINMLALVPSDGMLVPRVLNLRQILRYHIEWRQEVITKRIQFDLKKAQERAHILEGLLKAMSNIDAVIRTIRESASREVAKTSLMGAFTLTERQAQAILDMTLGRLAALERKRIEDEYTDLLKQIAGFEDLLKNPKKILTLIKNDLKQLKEKFGDNRRTLIMDETGGDLSVEDLIPDQTILVTITNKGYVKRLSHDTYKTQKRGGKGINGMTTREQDVIQHTIICSTMDSILFFTNKGRVFQLKAHEVPDAGRTAKGLPLVNLISVDQNEQITAVLPVSNFNKAEYLVMATRQGKIKRVKLDQFATVRSNGLIAIRLEDNDELGFVAESSGKRDIIMVTAEGKAIRFNEEDVRPMGRDATGVNAVKLLTEKDGVVGMDLVNDNANLLIITSTGVGKRTPLSEFPTHNRYGQGVIALKLTVKTGKIVATRVVSDNDELMMISTHGMVVRIAAKDVSQQGRAAQGVSVMSFSRSGDSLAAVAVLTESKSDRVVNQEIGDHDDVSDDDDTPDSAHNGNGKNRKGNGKTVAQLSLLDGKPTIEIASGNLDGHRNGNGRNGKHDEE